VFLRNFTPCPCKLWERSLTHDTREFSPKGRGRGHAPKNLRPECVDQSLLELTQKKRKGYKAHPSQQTPTRTYNRMPKANLPTKQHKIHDQPMPAQPNKKTLKIGNGDESRAFPIFLFKPKQRQQQQHHLQPIRNPSANPNKHHSSRIDCVPCSFPCEIAASR
jgi:hypothetical protein